MRRGVALLLLFLLGFLPVLAASSSPAGAQGEQIDPPDTSITAVMTELEPFIEDRDGRPSGFYAEIWQVIAAELGVDVEVLWVDRFADVLPAIDDGRADIAVAPLTPTRERDVAYDFTSAVVSSGPQLAYHERAAENTGVLRAVFSPPVRQILTVALIGLLILAHLIWFAERGRDDDESDDFDDRYLPGIWDGLWWATVTVTTVGYGDKAPRSTRGRVIALMAMVLSLFLVGAFVSQITDILQATRAAAPAETLSEVGDRPVAVVDGSTFAAYVEAQGANVAAYPNQAAAFEAATDGDVDFVVANPYALATEGRELGLVAVGDVLFTEFESFGLAQDSPWREPINQVLADLHSSGEIEAIVDRWVPDLAG